VDRRHQLLAVGPGQGGAGHHPPDPARGRHPVVFHAGKHPGIDGRGDGRDRHPQVERDLRGPLAGPLLAGLVLHQVDQRLAGLPVLHRQDLRGELHQEGGERPLVPAGENLARLGGGETETAGQKIVDLGDELHVAVFDPVVHHLHEVAGAVGAEVGHAGTGVGPGGDGLEDRPQRLPGILVSAWHDRGPAPDPLLAPGDAGPHEAEAPDAQVRLAPAGLLKVRVATIDDHVPGLEQGRQLADDVVDRLSGLDHEPDPTRALEGRHQLLERPAGKQAALTGAVVFDDELVGHRAVAVPDCHLESVVGDVEGEISAHDRQAEHPDVRFSLPLAHLTGSAFSS
jgi:hypothetical protein